MEKYLISTNVEGHLFGDYSTEKLLSKREAIEVLRYGENGASYYHILLRI